MFKIKSLTELETMNLGDLQAGDLAIVDCPANENHGDPVIAFEDEDGKVIIRSLADPGAAWGNWSTVQVRKLLPGQSVTLTVTE